MQIRKRNSGVHGVNNNPDMDFRETFFARCKDKLIKMTAGGIACTKHNYEGREGHEYFVAILLT